MPGRETVVIIFRLTRNPVDPRGTVKIKQGPGRIHNAFDGLHHQERGDIAQGQRQRKPAGTEPLKQKSRNNTGMIKGASPMWVT